MSKRCSAASSPTIVGASNPDSSSPEALSSPAQTELKEPSQISSSKKPEDRFIASVDVGTTTIRCIVFDGRLNRRGSCQEDVVKVDTSVGRSEIDPDWLFDAVHRVIKEAVANARLTTDQIECVALATQRGSFTTWSRSTGRHFHNIVCWNDLRANRLVDQWNSSWRFRLVSLLCKMLYLLSRNKRYLAASILRLTNQQVTMRLLWCIHNIPSLSHAISSGDALFGTIDTYLLYRLSGGRNHVTDPSAASATGLFDPFTRCWSSYIRRVFDIPSVGMMPEVVPTGGGSVRFPMWSQQLGNTPLPVAVSIGDQSASLFGAGCWEHAGTCITLGTGVFVDVNTGNSPHTSLNGIYPQVAWHCGDWYCFMAEGGAGEAADLLLWGQSIGLYECVSQCDALASEADRRDTYNCLSAVHFVPAFSGLAAPINDYCAASGFVGITRNTGRPELTRALLEAICFRVSQLYTCALDEGCLSTERTPTTVVVTGGVANCDYVCQLIADLLRVRVRREASVETTALGAAALAALAIGIWTSPHEMAELVHPHEGTLFLPNEKRGVNLRRRMEDWERALKRLGKWYQ